MRKRSSFDIFRNVLYALVLREVQGRFGTLRMGAVFTVLEPCLHILGFAVIFGMIRGGTVGGVDYSVFLLVSLAPFLLFRNIALQMMESLEANRALFAYRQILPLDTFIARTLVECALATIVFVIISVSFEWYGMAAGINNVLTWLIILLAGIVFSFGLGCMFAVVTDFAPQIKIFIRLSFLPLYFTSSVFFPPSKLPPQAINYLLWNPFLHLIEFLRLSALPNYKVADGVSLAFLMSASMLSLFIGLALYRTRRHELLRL